MSRYWNTNAYATSMHVFRVAAILKLIPYMGKGNPYLNDKVYDAYRFFSVKVDSQYWEKL